MLKFSKGKKLKNNQLWFIHFKSIYSNILEFEKIYLKWKTISEEKIKSFILKMLNLNFLTMFELSLALQNKISEKSTFPKLFNF